MDPVEPETLISRDELTGMLFTIADINANTAKILRLLEEELGGEEGLEEDNA
jgi:hypothetical protein